VGNPVEETGQNRSCCVQEDAGRLHALVHTLPSLQQQVLQLRYGDGLRCAEIAVLLNKREDTVRKMLSRSNLRPCAGCINRQKKERTMHDFKRIAGLRKKLSWYCSGPSGGLSSQASGTACLRARSGTSYTTCRCCRLILLPFHFDDAEVPLAVASKHAPNARRVRPVWSHQLNLLVAVLACCILVGTLAFVFAALRSNQTASGPFPVSAFLLTPTSGSVTPSQAALDATRSTCSNVSSFSGYMGRALSS